MGQQGRSPVLRLQSDDRLIALVRRGNGAAFEVLVARYQTRLLAFCRHLLGSREDAEDILQEVLASAYNAILADDRPINVRPWLYRIARNRSLNHLRRIQAVGVDSMDVHLSENGASTADKAHDREEFRLLMGDIQDLPETQRTALVLREMDALSYEQIAEAMETTVPSVKSLLVRARMSLAEAAEARLLSCEEVRFELAEVAEGLQRRPGSLVRRHLRACRRCSAFRVELRNTNKALTAVLPIGPFVLLKKFALVHLGHHAGAGSSAGGAGAAPAAAAGSTAAAGTTITVGSGGGLLSAGVGAIATKAVAGLAAAALVTAGAVEVAHIPSRARKGRAHSHSMLIASPFAPALIGSRSHHAAANSALLAAQAHKGPQTNAVAAKHPTATAAQPKAAVKPDARHVVAPATKTTQPQTQSSSTPQPSTTEPGRTQTQTDPTVLPSQPSSTSTGPADSGTSGATPTDSSSSTPSSSPSGGSTPSGGSGTGTSAGTTGSSGTSTGSGADPSSAPASSGTADPGASDPSASPSASSADAPSPSS